MGYGNNMEFLNIYDFFDHVVENVGCLWKLILYVIIIMIIDIVMRGEVINRIHIINRNNDKKLGANVSEHLMYFLLTFWLKIKLHVNEILI